MDKNDTNKYSGANTLINATFSKSKIGQKNEKKNRKTDCGMKYLLPKQTCMQKLVRIGR